MFVSFFQESRHTTAVHRQGAGTGNRARSSQGAHGEQRNVLPEHHSQTTNGVRRGQGVDLGSHQQEAYGNAEEIWWHQLQI